MAVLKVPLVLPHCHSHCLCVVRCCTSGAPPPSQTGMRACLHGFLTCLTPCSSVRGGQRHWPSRDSSVGRSRSQQFSLPSTLVVGHFLKHLKPLPSGVTYSTMRRRLMPCYIRAASAQSARGPPFLLQSSIWCFGCGPPPSPRVHARGWEQLLSTHPARIKAGDARLMS